MATVRRRSTSGDGSAAHRPAARLRQRLPRRGPRRRRPALRSLQRSVAQHGAVVEFVRMYRPRGCIAAYGSRYEIPGEQPSAGRLQRRVGARQRRRRRGRLEPGPHAARPSSARQPASGDGDEPQGRRTDPALSHAAGLVSLPDARQTQGLPPRLAQRRRDRRGHGHGRLRRHQRPRRRRTGAAPADHVRKPTPYTVPNAPTPKSGSTTRRSTSPSIGSGARSGRAVTCRRTGCPSAFSGEPLPEETRGMGSAEAHRRLWSTTETSGSTPGLRRPGTSSPTRGPPRSSPVGSARGPAP